jgi:hypothetical protein
LSNVWNPDLSESRDQALEKHGAQALRALPSAFIRVICGHPSFCHLHPSAVSPSPPRSPRSRPLFAPFANFLFTPHPSFICVDLRAPSPIRDNLRPFAGHPLLPLRALDRSFAIFALNSFCFSSPSSSCPADSAPGYATPSPRACTPSSSPHSSVRGNPGSDGYPHRAEEVASRMCAAACGRNTA